MPVFQYVSMFMQILSLLSLSFFAKIFVCAFLFLLRITFILGNLTFFKKWNFLNNEYKDIFCHRFSFSIALLTGSFCFTSISIWNYSCWKLGRNIQHFWVHRLTNKVNLRKEWIPVDTDRQATNVIYIQVCNTAMTGVISCFSIIIHPFISSSFFRKVSEMTDSYPAYHYFQTYDWLISFHQSEFINPHLPSVLAQIDTKC